VGEPSEAPRPHPNPSPEGEGSEANETRNVAAWAFDQILVMLHPLMPFITEELWHAMGERPYDLIVAKWPEPQAQVDPHAKDDIEWLIGLVSEIRSARTEMNVPPSARTGIWVEADDQKRPRLDLLPRFERFASALSKLARLDSVEFLYWGTKLNLRNGDKEEVQPRSGAKGALHVALGGAGYLLPLAELIDFEAETQRISKAATAAEKERDSLAQRLANPNFTERAKPEAVEKARADHEAKAAEADRLRAALERLG
jgi:valyl-tRNA synthetase